MGGRADAIWNVGKRGTKDSTRWSAPAKGGLKSESEVAQLCPTLCDPMDCSLPGSSVHGIFQVRVLEWVAISFSVTGNWNAKRKSDTWSNSQIWPWSAE